MDQNIYPTNHARVRNSRVCTAKPYNRTSEIKEVTGRQPYPRIQLNMPDHRARMIGRDPHLTSILELINGKSGQGGFILIDGEAGMGKSFLAVQNAMAQLDPTRFTIWSGRCMQQQSRQAY